MLGYFIAHTQYADRHIYIYIYMGNSFPSTLFGGIFLQPTTWQVNRPSTCTFSYMIFLTSYVTFLNNTCG